jgi:DNA-binding transcriptional MocR family regulator
MANRMKLFESIAERLISDIKTGRSPSGSRLPALRVLAKQHSVSITTAIKSYNYLEELGWIFAQPQSGYFVAKQLSKTDHPQLPQFKGESRDPKVFAPLNGYTPIVDFFSPLGTSMISPDLLPTLALQRSIKRSVSRSQSLLHQYPESQGDERLRQALSRHFRKDHFAFHDSELVITNGCIDAIRIAVETVSKAGDTIAISSPCYSGLLDLLVALSRNIVEIPSHDQGIDLDQLEIHMKNKDIVAGLFNTSHMNPGGASISKQQKQRMAQLANDYAIPIIEDDVYIELSHHGKPPLPTKYWDKKGYILWCGSVSKTLAAGLRIGWCLPGRYLPNYLNRHKLTGLGVNGLVQSSIAEFINTGDYSTHINKIRLSLNKHVHAYQKFLIENLPQNTRVSLPDGGIVLWVQIPGLDAVELEKQAKSQQIDIRSGSNFSTHGYYKDCFRINFGWPLQHSEENTSAYRQMKGLCALILQQIA